MNTHGYRLVANSKTAPSDFIPSLIGIEANQSSPAGTDTYFERVEIGEVEITSIARSRWFSYDSTPNAFRDPILGVKTNRGTFYSPFSELWADACRQNDSMVIEMIRALKLNIQPSAAA